MSTSSPWNPGTVVLRDFRGVREYHETEDGPGLAEWTHMIVSVLIKQKANVMTKAEVGVK